MWRVDPLLGKDLEKTNETTRLYNNRVTVGNGVFCSVCAAIHQFPHTPTWRSA
jgi:hypothetical protein